MALIVAICGGSGAGKTTLANRLKQIFQDDLIVLPYDSYCVDQSYLSLNERAKVNYDLPSSYDAELYFDHLMKLKLNKAIERPVFDFPTHTRKKETIKVFPQKIIVIEGIMVLQVPKLENLIDIRIFVDADSDIRLARRLLRDINERGRTPESVVKQYITQVKPSYEKFIKPKRKECLIFNNNKNDGLDEREVQNIVDIIKKAI